MWQCVTTHQYSPPHWSPSLSVCLSVCQSVYLFLYVCLCICVSAVWVKKYPPWGFVTFFQTVGIFAKRLGIFSPYFTCLSYTFLSTLAYKFLFNYLQLWWSYAISSATTQFTSYAQCPPSAETHVFRCLRKSSIALLIVVCGKSSQICCSALFSSGVVFGFDWSLWNAWSITHHTW